MAKSAQDSRSTIGSKVKNRRQLMVEIRHEAAEFSEGLRIDMDPAQAVQQVLDNMVPLYEYATQQVFLLAEEEYWRETISGKVPNEWIREQERLGLQMVHIASKAAGMGLAERAVQLEEAKAAMVGAYLSAVLKQLNLSPEQKAALKPAMDSAMPILEGHARELPQAVAA